MTAFQSQKGYVMGPSDPSDKKPMADVGCVAIRHWNTLVLSVCPMSICQFEFEGTFRCAAIGRDPSMVHVRRGGAGERTRDRLQPRSL